MKRLQVLMLTTGFPRFVGDLFGAFILEQARALVANGVEVKVVAPHQHGLQIGQIEEQQPLLIRRAERDIEHALLRVRQVHHPRQQQRTEFGDRGAHRMAALSEKIKKDGRICAVVEISHADLRGARRQGLMRLAVRIAGSSSASARGTAS